MIQHLKYFFGPLKHFDTTKPGCFPQREACCFFTNAPLPLIVPHVHGRRAQWRSSPNYTRDVQIHCSSASLPSCRFHTDQFSGRLRCSVNHPTLVVAARTRGGKSVHWSWSRIGGEAAPSTISCCPRGGDGGCNCCSLVCAVTATQMHHRSTQFRTKRVSRKSICLNISKTLVQQCVLLS